MLIICFLLAPITAIASNESTSAIFKPNDLEIQKLTEEIATTPDNAVLYYTRGITYLKSRGSVEFFKNKYDVLATEDFTKAIELNPNYAATYIFRGLSITSESEHYKGKYTKENKQAIEDYNAAIKIDPDFALAYRLRAVSYTRLENYDLALSDANRAIELDPKTARSYFIKANALNKKHKTQEAIETLRQIKTIIPPNTLSPEWTLARQCIRELGGTP